MGTRWRSSKPKKAPPTARQSLLALAPACGLPSTPPATPPFASPRASIPNPQPSPPSTPAIPLTAASIPPLARFLLPTKLAMRLSPIQGFLEPDISHWSKVTCASVIVTSPSSLVEILRERIKPHQKHRHQRDRRI